MNLFHVSMITSVCTGDRFRNKEKEREMWEGGRDRQIERGYVYVCLYVLKAESIRYFPIQFT